MSGKGITLRSGGQTGVDRAAFDAAIELRLPYGGWVPKGRLDEFGAIPRRYVNLIETPREDPRERTELNVRDSDATLIISRGALTGGSALTLQAAERYGKPCLHLDLALLPVTEALSLASGWLRQRSPSELTIAGPRASEDPAIYDIARRLLLRLLDPAGATLAHEDD